MSHKISSSQYPAESPRLNHSKLSRVWQIVTFTEATPLKFQRVLYLSQSTQLSPPICAYVFRAVSFLQVFQPRPWTNDAIQFKALCNIRYQVNLHGKEDFPQTPSWRVIPYKLSVVAYSMYSQLRFISGGHRLYTYPEHKPCCSKDIYANVRTSQRYLTHQITYDSIW